MRDNETYFNKHIVQRITGVAKRRQVNKSVLENSSRLWAVLEQDIVAAANKGHTSLQVQKTMYVESKEVIFTKLQELGFSDIRVDNEDLSPDPDEFHLPVVDITFSVHWDG